MRSIDANNDGFNDSKEIVMAKTKQFEMAPKKGVSKNTIIIIASSIASAICLSLVYFLGQKDSFVVYSAEFIISFLVGIAPFTFIQLREVKRKDGIDRSEEHTSELQSH